jgi:phage terminase small subunit
MLIRGGQRPKPTILKDLHGSTTKREPDEPLPVGDLSADDCPYYFTLDQREEWEDKLRHSPPGMIKRVDARLFEDYVVAICLHRRAVMQLGNGPLLVPCGQQKVPNPLIRMIREQGEVARKKGSELGFSPTSRPRIGAPGSAISATMNSASHAKPKDAPRQSLEAYLASTPRAAVN